MSVENVGKAVRSKLSIITDLRSHLLLIPAALYIAFVDLPVAKSLLFSLAGMSLILGFAHFARRMLFSSLDLSTDIDAAESGNMAAAIVVLSIVLFYVALILGAVLWLRG